MRQKATFDIVLIGGGITGLWAVNRLRQLNYSVALLENEALGAGQTIKSQGIIHGGIKYALTGFLNKASEGIAAMPKRWQNCLQGQGDIDLRHVNILSQDQCLWSTGHLASEITSFFASKALKSRVQTLQHEQYPSLLQNKAFKGKVYRLDEVVLDVPSLIKVLAEPQMNSIFKIDLENGLKIYQGQPKNYDQNGSNHDQNNAPHHDQNQIQYLTIQARDPQSNDIISAEISAKRYIFAAGEGNAHLLKNLDNTIKMQARPLHMVLVKLPQDYRFYAHCIEQGTNPRITITSHTTQDGKPIWYLGGQLAEEGVTRSLEEQCQAAKQELQNLFPWISWHQAEFKSFYVNRAEGTTPGGKRPDSFFLKASGNALIAWPTKLALAPLLCDELIHHLETNKIFPTPELASQNALKDFQKPTFAQPMWDILFSEQ